MSLQVQVAELDCFSEPASHVTARHFPPVPAPKHHPSPVLRGPAVKRVSGCKQTVQLSLTDGNTSTSLLCRSLSQVTFPSPSIQFTTSAQAE
jgi:hypothetical protein